MDAKALLRQYLEQRRELGERDLILDTMSVDDALRVLGVHESAREGAREARELTKPPSHGSTVSRMRETDIPRAPSEPVATGPLVPPVPTVRAPKSEPASDDWRENLRAAGAAPPGPDVAEVAEPKDAAPPAPSEPGIIVGSASTELFGGPLSDVATLDALAKLIAACTSCGLYATAKNPVPGEGNPNADFVCVGEAPGGNEDETGRPFVGQAGGLLTKILASVDLRREDVFICNVLKHRPPGNRNPAPDEIVACRPYLMRQLELLRPKVILALGTFAAQTLLDTKLAIGKLRGQVHTFYGIPLVVTYHPAALLRNPAWKRPTWEDVKLARRLLDRTNGNA